MKQKIGFIGLGEMGKWMSLNMVKAGYRRLGLRHQPCRGQIPDRPGRQGTAISGGFGRQGRLDFLSLPDTQVVETVIFGEDGILHGARKGLGNRRFQHDQLYPDPGDRAKTEGERGFFSLTLRFPEWRPEPGKAI